jgi:hypothetical protein
VLSRQLKNPVVANKAQYPARTGSFCPFPHPAVSTKGDLVLLFPILAVGARGKNCSCDSAESPHRHECLGPDRIIDASETFSDLSKMMEHDDYQECC